MGPKPWLWLWLWLVAGALRRVSCALASLKPLERSLLSLLNTAPLNLVELQATIAALETSASIPKPCTSAALDGTWRLLYTGNENVENASPIQRTVTSLKQVKIFQVLRTYVVYTLDMN